VHYETQEALKLKPYDAVAALRCQLCARLGLQLAHVVVARVEIESKI
jgi:hypothetical protein